MTRIIIEFVSFVQFVSIKTKPMRVVIQRVKEASVTIDAKIKSDITEGLLILVGVEDVDTEEDLKWLAAKIVNLRIFGDENRSEERRVGKECA